MKQITRNYVMTEHPSVNQFIQFVSEGIDYKLFDLINVPSTIGLNDTEAIFLNGYHICLFMDINIDNNIEILRMYWWDGKTIYTTQSYFNLLVLRLMGRFRKVEETEETSKIYQELFDSIPEELPAKSNFFFINNNQ